jgi:hypothetical protein
MKTYRILLLIIGIGALATCAQALKAHFTMDPMVADDARPGQLINRQFDLTLAADEQPTQFKAKVEDWWHSEDGKQTFFKPAGTLAHSCATWVQLNPVESTVASGDTLHIKASITVPIDAKPGGYWAVLTVDEVNNPLAVTPQGENVRFLASISIGIYVYVTPVKRAASIRDITLSATQASIKMRNDGDCPLHVEGRIEFMKPGETTVQAVATIVREVLLPEPINTGIFTINLPDTTLLPSGRYRVRVVLDIGLDHYIGAQREMDIQREVTVDKTK